MKAFCSVHVVTGKETIAFGQKQVCFLYYNSTAFRQTEHNATYQKSEGGRSDENRNTSRYVMSFHVTSCNVFVFDYILH
jgi:hypothetical protein